MRLWYILGFLLGLLFVIGAGCKESPCPEGYAFVNEECCEDADENGICDSGQVIGGEEEEQIVEEEYVPPVDTGYVWDSARISVASYTCGNSSISLNLKNNLPNSVSVEKARLGTTYARGLPFFIKKGETKDMDIANPSLVKGEEIGLSLFIQYKDFVKKETRTIGPAELEGIC